MKLWPLQPRQPFTGLALAAVLGIVLADRWPLPPALLLIECALAAAALALWPRTWLCWLFTALAFVTLHTLRHHHSPARALAAELETPRVVHATGIVWSEPDPPETWSRTVAARFRMKLERIAYDGTSRAPDVVVNVNWSGAMPAYGDRVELTGTAANLVPVRNPGQPDFSAYLRRKGIWSEIRTAYASDCRILSQGHGRRAQAAAFASRHWVKAQLERDLGDSPQIYGLIESMVLGLKSETPADVRELFQRTGTLHLFAVSGLNVAMLGALVWALLKPLRIRRAAAVFVIIPVLCGYALVTGLSASCVRATIMGALILLAYAFDRRPTIYNSLSAAAFLILAWDTNQFFSPGFQFSFALVFSIAFCARRIQGKVEPLGQPDAFLPRPLWSWKQVAVSWSSRQFAATVGVTVAAWVGSLFFTVGYFHLFSPVAIIANLFAVLLAFAVLALGLMSVLTSAFWPAAAVLSNNANWLCAKALLGVIELCARVPGGNLYVESPRAAPAPQCEITVFDLDAGGAAHLRHGGRDWLLDCGSSFRYAQTVLPYLRSRGVNRLDALLLTHGDAEHLGGSLAALRDFHPRQVIDSPLPDRSTTRRGLHAELARLSRGKIIAQRGDIFAAGPGATVRVLYPPAGLERGMADDKALVLRLECGGVRALFMSDSGFATEQWLLENEPDLRADILVKGQHARDLSGTLDFIARVQPQAIVCSSLDLRGEASALDDWERAVLARGIAVLRQDRTGAVRIAIDRGEFTLAGFLDRQIFRSRAR